MNHPMAERYSIHITAYATEGRCYSSCWNNNDLIKGRLIYCLLFVILADGRWVFIFIFPYVENVYYVHVHGISYSSF